jgi:hypothetical protein
MLCTKYDRKKVCEYPSKVNLCKISFKIITIEYSNNLTKIISDVPKTMRLYLRNVVKFFLRRFVNKNPIPLFLFKHSFKIR